MSEHMTTNGQSRRNVLKRGLVLAAGAIGVTAGGREAIAATRPASSSSRLRLHGSNWRLAVPGRQPGAMMQLGDYGAVYGDLFDKPAGKPLGQFFASRLAVQSTPGGHVRADASVEVHTFVLPHGTIIGMGTSVLGEALFAVVGGTGAYAGVTGTYTANQRLRELGGNGTADFNMTLDGLKE
ncbi:MAG TPA: hypothetical protein VII51_00270 [Gaiellaceae bacterium]